jgi:hypothetical protein
MKNFSNIKIIKITKDSQRKLFGNKIKEMDNITFYPFGDKYFTIDHNGENSYFDFFERIGDIESYCLIEFNDDDNDFNILATFTIIIRKIKNQKLLYLCDLKKNNNLNKNQYNNINITGMLMEYFFKEVYLSKNKNLSNQLKFYTIHMNDIKFKKNKIIKLYNILLSKLTYNKPIGYKYLNNIKQTYKKNNFPILNIYSLTFDQLFIFNDGFYKILMKEKNGLLNFQGDTTDSKQNIGKRLLIYNNIDNDVIENINNKNIIKPMKLIHLTFDKKNKDNLFSNIDYLKLFEQKYDIKDINFINKYKDYTFMFSTLQNSNLTMLIDDFYYCENKNSNKIIDNPQTATISYYGMENELDFFENITTDEI